jgi:hypothetical protein
MPPEAAIGPGVFGGTFVMRYLKQPILISLLLFAAVAYMPSSHVVADHAAYSEPCTMSAQ